MTKGRSRITNNYIKKIVIACVICVVGIVGTINVNADTKKVDIVVNKTKTIKVKEPSVKVKWTIKNKKIVKIVKIKGKKNNILKIKGIKTGKTKIIAKYKNKKRVFIINVVNKNKKKNTDSEKTLLLEHNGSEGNLIFIVDKPEFLIGKSKEADGTIANSTKVSRNHCRIVRENGSYMIQDLESTNGTSVNGYTLEPDQKYYLKDGDSLVLADVEFKITVS